MALGQINGSSEPQIRFIPLSYSSEDADSAARLIAQLRPDWAPESIRFTRFTDGITNTLLKAVSTDSDDADAILLRAYGNGTDLLIDRHRETQNHELLWRHGLAPELLARFENGMLYRYVRGSVTSPADLRDARVYRAVARRLAQWHATVPCLPGQTGHARRPSRAAAKPKEEEEELVPEDEAEFQRAVDGVAPGKPTPNVWTVMQKWIFALPTETEAQRQRQAELQRELKWLVGELSQREGLGKNGLVFAHCDLLSGNVIVLPRQEGANGASTTNGTSSTDGDDQAPATGTSPVVETVTFIDYEYATPSPAAFDIANHFAEWGGFDCDFNVLPTRRQRRDFIAEYVRSYFDLLPAPSEDGRQAAADVEAETDKLFGEVDVFRGVPGFYWGVWAMIQATISTIAFDYASYAETRLGEYWAWKAEADGSRAAAGREMPLRERRWAQEE